MATSTGSTRLVDYMRESDSRTPEGARDLVLRLHPELKEDPGELEKRVRMVLESDQHARQEG
jgi:hypothetical protein